MATDKHVLSEEVIQLNKAWTPAYNPFFRMLTEKGLKTTKHTSITGTVKTKETNILGSARAEVIDPQDTEIRHAKSGASDKTFNKYMLGIKYIQSVFQGNSDLQRCADQILEANLQKFDEDAFSGAPTQAGILRNNGFYNSSDSNFVVNPAATLPANATLDQLKAVFDNVLEQGENLVGNAAKIMAMTRNIASFLGKFVPHQAISFAQAIRDAYAAEGVNVSFVTIPANLTTEAGIELITPSLVTLDYIELPYINARGTNEEDGYQYIKELHGSTRVDVEKKGAIIKQAINLS